MVNYSSAIAMYGFQDIPLNLEAKTNDLGIKLILIPLHLEKSNLGSQVSELVNNTSALFIFEGDEELYTVVQFYFAANKKVFFIAEHENTAFLPNGVKIISSLEEAFRELLIEKEKFVIDSRIGKLELRFNAFGLTYLKSSKQKESTEKLSKQAQKVYNQLESYFDGRRKSFKQKVCLLGTDFQRKVWGELTNIPYGHTISYGELATKVGDANAFRAVGLAISKNPIWFVIPCHRVLSKEGDLTGYAGGLELKQFLLDIEAKQMSLF